MRMNHQKNKTADHKISSRTTHQTNKKGGEGGAEVEVGSPAAQNPDRADVACKLEGNLKKKKSCRLTEKTKCADNWNTDALQPKSPTHPELRTYNFWVFVSIHILASLS